MSRNDPWDVLCAGIDQKMATGHYASRYEAMLAVQRERPELVGAAPHGMRGGQISAPRPANARGLMEAAVARLYGDAKEERPAEQRQPLESAVARMCGQVTGSRAR